jgi:hypothetical protein
MYDKPSMGRQLPTDETFLDLPSDSRKAGGGSQGWQRDLSDPETRYSREGKEIKIGLKIAEGITDIDEIAEVLSEDINDDHVHLLDPVQEKMKKIAESFGFKVAVTVEEIND